MRVLAWPGMPAHASLREAARRVGADGVEIAEVASNELLHERMLADGPWDLVFPSDYLVERLIADGALAPLSGLPLERLAGWARAGEWDPGCRHSVPFAYGTTGYVVSGASAGSGAAAAGASSWATLLRPAPRVRVSMLDEVREVVGAALIHLGHGPNETDPAALAAARELLERQRPAVVATGADVRHSWSGPSAALPRGSRYVVPDEGAIFWVTTGAVPAGAPAAAMRMLAELMDPELAARTTTENGYATPNEAARALVPAHLRDDRALFPDDATRARCHALHDLGTEEERLRAVWPLG